MKRISHQARGRDKERAMSTVCIWSEEARRVLRCDAPRNNYLHERRERRPARIQHRRAAIYTQTICNHRSLISRKTLRRRRDTAEPREITIARHPHETGRRCMHHIRHEGCVVPRHWDVRRPSGKSTLKLELDGRRRRRARCCILSTAANCRLRARPASRERIILVSSP